MKKLSAIFSLLVFVCALNAQNAKPIVNDGSRHPIPLSHPFKLKKSHQPASPRDTCPTTVAFTIDYGGFDYVYSQNWNNTTGGNSVIYFDSSEYINNNYPNSASGTLQWATTLFDTLVNADQTNNNFQYYPLATSQVRLDSLDVVFTMYNVSGHYDTILISVFCTDSFTTSGQVMSGNTMSYNTSWDTMIITNTSIIPNLDPFDAGFSIFKDATMYPGITYPRGKSFGIRVDFMADTADHFTLINDLRDDCNQACTCSPSAAAFNSFAYFNIMSGGTNLSGIDDYPAMDVFYDCNGNGQFDPDSCEALFVEDWWIFPSVTIYPPTFNLTTANVNCGGSYQFNGQNLTTSGWYYDTLTAGNGCDSIIALNLTVTTGFDSTITASICSGQSFMGHTQSGTYYDTLSSGGGCDSMLTLMLSVNPLPSVTMVNPCLQSGCYFCATINATTTNTDSMNWHVIGTNEGLPVDTTIVTDDTLFMRSIDGGCFANLVFDPFVPISVCFTAYNSCGSTSVCDTITIVEEGINDIANLTNLTLLPNPTSDLLNINYKLNEETNIQINIMDIEGRKLITWPQQQTAGGFHSKVIDVSKLASGVYILNFQTNTGSLNRKFVKQ